jgi:hypothetical protein
MRLGQPQGTFPAIESGSASNPFDKHHFDFGCALADRAGGLIFRRMKVGAGRLLAVELEHDVARPSLALERLIASAAHKNSSAMGRDGFHRVGRIAGVGLGIGHVDVSDDIAFGHLGRFLP